MNVYAYNLGEKIWTLIKSKRVKAQLLYNH